MRMEANLSRLLKFNSSNGFDTAYLGGTFLGAGNLSILDTF